MPPGDPGWPAPLDEFVGRADDLDAISAALARARLVTVTGFGGLGKTRLVLEHHRTRMPADRHGVLVELQAVPVGTDLAEVLLTALGVVDHEGAAEPALLAYLSDRTLMLVLDGCEPVLGELRPLVAACLRRAPGLGVLATSIEPLGIAGEQVLSLCPLSVVPPDAPEPDIRASPAVSLLAERAAAAAPGFELDGDDLRAAATLCARLDGSPLAIELAAARLRSMGVSDLVVEIEDRFALLTRGDPTATPRHRSLRATMEWSYQLCSPGERRMWGQLSTFRGGATRAAVLAVCTGPETDGDDGSVVDRLDALVARSVVHVVTTMAGPVYTTLQSVAEFGRDMAAGDPYLAEVRARYVACYRDKVQAAWASWMGPQQAENARRLAVEFGDLQAVFDLLLATDAAAAQELASSLVMWWMGSRVETGRRWLRQALEVDRTPSYSRMVALCRLALLTARHPESVLMVEEAEQIRVSLGLVDAQGAVLAARSTSLTLQFHFEAGREVAEAALRVADPIVDPFSHACALASLAGSLSYLGDSRAEAAAQTYLDFCAGIGDSWGMAYASMFRLAAAVLRTDVPAAAEIGLETLRLAARSDNPAVTARALNLLGQLALKTGRIRLGGRLAGAAVEVGDRVGLARSGPGPNAPLRMPAVLQGVSAAVVDDTFDRAFEEGRRLGPEQAEALVRRLSPTPSAHAGSELTRRELDVVRGLVRGLTNKEIAAELFLSTRTVEGHVERIATKLGVRRRTEIATWAIRELDH